MSQQEEYLRPHVQVSNLREVLSRRGRRVALATKNVVSEDLAFNYRAQRRHIIQSTAVEEALALASQQSYRDKQYKLVLGGRRLDLPRKQEIPRQQRPKKRWQRPARGVQNQDHGDSSVDSHHRSRSHGNDDDHHPHHHHHHYHDHDHHSGSDYDFDHNNHHQRNQSRSPGPGAAHSQARVISKPARDGTNTRSGSGSGVTATATVAPVPTTSTSSFWPSSSLPPVKYMPSKLSAIKVPKGEAPWTSPWERYQGSWHHQTHVPIPASHREDFFSYDGGGGGLRPNSAANVETLWLGAVGRTIAAMTDRPSTSSVGYGTDAKGCPGGVNGIGGGGAGGSGRNAGVHIKPFAQSRPAASASAGDGGTGPSDEAKGADDAPVKWTPAAAAAAAARRAPPARAPEHPKERRELDDDQPDPAKELGSW
jgi:hypothetical protein